VRKGTAVEGLALEAPVTVGRLNADGSYTLTVAELQAIEERVETDSTHLSVTRELVDGQPVGLDYVIDGSQYYKVEVTLRPVPRDDGDE